MTRTAPTRRALLAATALVPLAGCNLFGTLTPSTVITQALALANGLSGMLTQLAAADPALIPASTLKTLQTDLTLATGAANALDTNLPAANGASIAQTIDGYINAVLTTLAAPPINGLIPSPFNMAVSAAALLVPQLEAFINQYLPASMTKTGASPAAMAARAKFSAAAPALTPAGALVVLQGYAK